MDVSASASSNWMRYVSVTMDKNKKNCDAFQYQGLIFFRTIRTIEKNEELIVGQFDHKGLLLKQDPEICDPLTGTILNP